jgi:hypothetical protein
VTNFDPAGFLVLLTVIPSVAAGIVSIGGAHLAARLGVETYERSVLAIVGALIAVWVVAAVVVSTAVLQVLAVTLAMVGAYAATRNVSLSSYVWVVGVVLLFVAFRSRAPPACTRASIGTTSRKASSPATSRRSTTAGCSCSARSAVRGWSGFGIWSGE